MLVKLLVFFLIFCPFRIGVPKHVPKCFWDELKQQALILEVVGDKERWIDDFNSEVEYVRKHFREVINSPPLSYSNLLPPSRSCRESRSFLLSLSNKIDILQSVRLHHRKDYGDLKLEVSGELSVWALIDTAACESNSWVCRRTALRCLEEMGYFDCSVKGETK